ALLLALCRLSNSLRDGHLTFSACPSVNGAARLSLPVAFSVLSGSEGPRFIVSQAAASTGVAPGDVLLSYDHVPSTALLDHFRLDLNTASVGVRAEQLAHFLSRRYAFGQEVLGAQ